MLPLIVTSDEPPLVLPMLIVEYPVVDFVFKSPSIFALPDIPKKPPFSSETSPSMLAFSLIITLDATTLTPSESETDASPGAVIFAEPVSSKEPPLLT